MTEPGSVDQSHGTGDPSWHWRHERVADQLRVEHDAFYREFREAAARTDAHFEKVDRDLLAFLPVPSEVGRLTLALDRLSDKLDGIVASSTMARRGEWQMAIQLGLLFIAAAAAFFVGHGGHP